MRNEPNDLRRAETVHTFRVMHRHPPRADRVSVGRSRYEFRIRGRLGEKLLATFEGFDAEVEPVETVLRGSVADQAALHGILEQFEALGLELVEVRQMDARAERLGPANANH